MTDKRLDAFDTGFEHGKGIKTSSVTTEKLTLRIAMLYPEAKITGVTDKEAFSSKPFIRVGYDNIVDFLRERDTGMAILSDCKLILRPLSSLTEEEEYQLELFDNYPDIINDTGLKVATGDVKFIDTLREWNIDIDGLQERGIAVYE